MLSWPLCSPASYYAVTKSALVEKECLYSLCVHRCLQNIHRSRYKLDGCGAQRDIELWAHMFNHSITERRAANVTVRASPLGMMIENCHDDDGWPRGNEPYYEDDTGQLWCPFHTYRTSGDARPTYGSLMNNLNSTRRLADANLSVPGCWACEFC